jgi:hypothetical protein
LIFSEEAEDFRYVIFIISVFNFIASMVIEKKLVPFICDKWSEIRNKDMHLSVIRRERSFKLNELHKMNTLAKNT